VKCACSRVSAELAATVERNQERVANLQKLQSYELRLQGLELRENILSQREQELSTKAAEMEKLLQVENSGLAPTGVPQTALVRPCKRAPRSGLVLRRVC